MGERKRDFKRECEVIEQIMAREELDEYGKIYAIQSYLLGWITEDQALGKRF